MGKVTQDGITGQGALPGAKQICTGLCIGTIWSYWDPIPTHVVFPEQEILQELLEGALPQEGGQAYKTSVITRDLSGVTNARPSWVSFLSEKVGYTLAEVAIKEL